MALFFLHQRRASDYIPDVEGAEFEDLAAAREEALIAARELTSENALKGFVDLGSSFEIEGPDGQRSILRFSEAVELRK